MCISTLWMTYMKIKRIGHINQNITPYNRVFLFATIWHISILLWKNRSIQIIFKWADFESYEIFSVWFEVFQAQKINISYHPICDVLSLINLSILYNNIIALNFHRNPMSTLKKSKCTNNFGTRLTQFKKKVTKTGTHKWNNIF